MKTLLAILFIFITSSSFSQGNLQFNQVLLLDASTAGTAFNVPAGKVWKIENVACSVNPGYVLLQQGAVSFWLSNTSTGYNHLPFWLPSGASFSFVGSAASKVSIIEFNVVP